MQITNRELNALVEACGTWLKMSETSPPAEKFTYAVRKVNKAAVPLHQAYVDAHTDIAIAHAEEKDGVLRHNEKGELQFSKAGVQKRNAEQRTLAGQTTDLTPFLVKSECIPADLPLALRDVFEGWIIPVPASAPMLELVEKAE
jgi:hypothetical protein